VEEGWLYGEDAERSGTAVGQDRTGLVRTGRWYLRSPERKNKNDGPKSDAHDGTL
jgi:hypothetical protein